MDFQLALSIAIFSFVTSVTPGPNNMFLLTSGANFGVRKSLPYINGIIIGLTAMAVALGSGLGVLFTTFPVVYQILKYVGFAYIVYLAIGIVRSTGKSADAKAEYIGTWRSFIFQFVNPKAWIVTASFMASYVPVHAGWFAAAIAVAMFLIFTYPGAAIWALFGQTLKSWLEAPRKRKIFNNTAAILLVASMLPVLFLH